MVQKDKVPVYEETLEDNGRFNEQPVSESKRERALLLETTPGLIQS
jgi:hypothetical protein